MDPELLRAFQQVGADLYVAHLITSHGGNLSVRSGEELIITRHGAMLGHLEAADLVRVPVEGSSEADAGASTDLPVHRAIYRNHQAQAVVHAHPPHVVAVSLLGHQQIIPRDTEGAHQLGRVPVLGQEVLHYPKTEDIIAALAEHPLVVLFGHGSFSLGSDLFEALSWTTALEASCQIMVAARLLSSG